MHMRETETENKGKKKIVITTAHLVVRGLELVVLLRLVQVPEVCRLRKPSIDNRQVADAGALKISVPERDEQADLVLRRAVTANNKQGPLLPPPPPPPPPQPTSNPPEDR